MADLVAFPQRQNIGKARHVAALWLQRRPGPERDIYWTSVCKRYTAVMRRCGFDEPVIRQELAGFCAAVEEQIIAITDRTEQRALDRAGQFVDAVTQQFTEAMASSSDFRRSRDTAPSRDGDHPGAA